MFAPGMAAAQVHIRVFADNPLVCRSVFRVSAPLTGAWMSEGQPLSASACRKGRIYSLSQCERGPWTLSFLQVCFLQNVGARGVLSVF